MKIICNTWVSDPQVGASSQCTKPAVLVILYRPLYDDRGSCEECGYDSEPVWVGYCLDHGPEEVHEARSSMSEDEYAIVNLPLTPKCSACGAELVNEDCPNYGNGSEHWQVCRHGRVECLRCAHWSIGAPRQEVTS